MKQGEELIRALRESINIPEQVVLGEVTAVDTGAQTATIKLDTEGNATYEVRLKAIIDKNEAGFIVFPAVGAKLLAAKIYNNDDYYMLTCSENQEVWINGRANGELINITEITSKLNNLVDEVDNLRSYVDGHTHAGVTSGNSSTGPLPIYTGSFSQFNEDDYKDEKVKH